MNNSIPNWSNVPGVNYPSHGRLHPIKKQLTPKDWMTTKEAAELFKCSGSAVRICLNKRKVESHIICPIGGFSHKVWNRKQVMDVFERFYREVKNVCPEGYVSSEDAVKFLGCSRSSLFRYEEKGYLHPVKVRLVNENRKRTHKMYSIEELERFKVEQDEIEAARQHMQELIDKRQGGAHE